MTFYRGAALARLKRLHLFFALCAIGAGISSAFAQAPATGSNPCPRFSAGATAINPPSLYSVNGALTVNLAYNTATDSAGRTLYCFTEPDGTESPTLHVRPGDTLTVNVTNKLPAPAPSSEMQMSTSAPVCGAMMMNASSVNIHYHGTNVSPACHSDEVIRTLINPGDKFTYTIQFPRDEPPGLYWYHPHVHGIAETAVQGGASGIIVVDGIENIQPAVSTLAERILVVRDQPVAGNPTPGGPVPSWDLTLNYIPISYPALTPAKIQMQSGKQEFWRLANSSADTILDVQVVFDGAPQTLLLVALDGVPVGSQDASAIGILIPVTHMRIPPASRAEFIVASPDSTVRSAQFVTQAINTGPDGDSDTARTIATITAGSRPVGTSSMALANQPPWTPRFLGLDTAPVNTVRKLYFSENANQTQFYITVNGQKPVVFSADNPPAIVTHQGQVEDWIIENRAQENHEFHFHQIHFLVLQQNNFTANGSQPVQAIQGQMMDMIEIPFWDGNPNHPYPSVRVRMDFRGSDIGDFVYHCHILNHEDQGMMAIIRVLP